jgi:hypothetical protein
LLADAQPAVKQGIIPHFAHRVLFNVWSKQTQSDCHNQGLACVLLTFRLKNAAESSTQLVNLPLFAAVWILTFFSSCLENMTPEFSRD